MPKDCLAMARHLRIWWYTRSCFKSQWCDDTIPGRSGLWCREPKLLRSRPAVVASGTPVVNVYYIARQLLFIHCSSLCSRIANQRARHVRVWGGACSRFESRCGGIIPRHRLRGREPRSYWLIASGAFFETQLYMHRRIYCDFVIRVAFDISAVRTMSTQHRAFLVTPDVSRVWLT